MNHKQNLLRYLSKLGEMPARRNLNPLLQFRKHTSFCVVFQPEMDMGY